MFLRVTVDIEVFYREPETQQNVQSLVSRIEKNQRIGYLYSWLCNGNKHRLRRSL